ncbi:hypothetical protein D9758_011540 [Tetrapyrgos nigripes]|uniref:Golgi apparatus membrane protein TVP38 n=1 Tax=Tetrapyrgos nigripes TaxID=182062 RepID=A0A8H5CPZ6_9AGAR|nr:hypothetical protein D9758_011540 [Tetrapyrgos nigripes]
MASSTISPNANYVYPAVTYPTRTQTRNHQHSPSASDVPLIAPSPIPLLEVASTSKNLVRDLTRTPSPTPSEVEALEEETRIGFINQSKGTDGRRWWYYLILIIVAAIVILFVVFRNQIIHGLEPATHWLHDTPGGWLVPIAIMIIISFPPLAGHEIVAMLCGIAWGLGYGFLIVAAGTLIVLPPLFLRFLLLPTELRTGNANSNLKFSVFRYIFFKKLKQRQTKNIAYACLVKVIQEGGFWIALLIRYSLIPAHISTTIFAFCGMSSLSFLASAILSLPKQFVVVYLGWSLGQSTDGESNHTEKIVNIVVIVVGSVVGFVAIRYVNRRINQVKPRVVYERRKARQQQKLSEVMSGSSAAGSEMNTAYPPSGSQSVRV